MSYTSLRGTRVSTGSPLISVPWDEVREGPQKPSENVPEGQVFFLPVEEAAIWKNLNKNEPPPTQHYQIVAKARELSKQNPPPLDLRRPKIITKEIPASSEGSTTRTR